MATRFRSALVSAAAAALIMPAVAVLAGAAPASASSPRPHEVAMYKVERHVDLGGEYPDNWIDTTLSCNGGDYVLEGMWRVDHVDQAQPPDSFGDERNVTMAGSYGDVSDVSKWHFRMTNFADGDAQIKLFLTCIRGQVDPAFGHAHNLVISAQKSVTQSSMPAGSATVAMSPGCDVSALPVAPGFSFSSHAQGSRIYRSWPSTDLRSWQWAFQVNVANLDVTTTLRCLDFATTQGGAGSHVHKLFSAFRPVGSAGDHQYLDVSGMQERRINCDDGADGKYFSDYKAMVGAFWIDDYTHAWFLGMDPRPKQRSYKFWWDGSGSNNVWLGAQCIRARTGKQVAS